MENSFIKYRNEATDESSSDAAEYIDNSFVEEITYSAKKKNQTVFVPESDESATDDDDLGKNIKKKSKTVITKHVAEQHVISSSDDDTHQRINAPRSPVRHTVVVGSSDEGEISPEMLPKRPPQTPKSKLNDSTLMQRNKKRLLLRDSDTDNSIIIEHNRCRKLVCQKDTPLKIGAGNKINNADVSMEYAEDTSTPSKSSKDVADSEESDENNLINDNSRSEKKGDKGSVINESIEDTDATEESDAADDIKKKIISNKKNIKSKHRFSTSDDSSGESFKSDEGNLDDSTDSDSDSLQSNKKNNEITRNDNSDSSDDENDKLKTPFRTGKKHRRNVIVSDDSSDEENSKTTPVQREDRAKNNSVTSGNSCVKGRRRFSSKNESCDSVKIHKSPLANPGKSKDSTRKGSYYDSESDDGPDEDLMVMSRATRMSIMGVIPKGNDTDESDFIESDSSHQRSGDSTTSNNQPELSETSSKNITRKSNSPLQVSRNPENGLDTTRLSCSPFSNPFHDITNVSRVNKNTDAAKVTIDLNHNLNNNDEGDRFKGVKENLIKYDDDISIISQEPEVILLSSDDEDKAIAEAKSPKTKKSPNTIKKFLQPKTDQQNSKNDVIKSEKDTQRPANRVVYVPKDVRENELAKLDGMKSDLLNVKNLLAQMEVHTLPDGGVKLIERMTELTERIRRQGDLVANMVVELEESPTAGRNGNDGADKAGLTWDDIQKASNSVQPRMFGKQAMATHMYERGVILERLRDLHGALASCPQEAALAPQPAAVRTALMPHQRHALAWLRWRETQRPPGGILADDMGLGKTITMISLIITDKENKIDQDSDDDGVMRASKPLGGTLVVCPASLVQQWAGEVTAHCAPHALSVSLHHGPTRATHPHRLATSDIVITTYNIVQRDHEKTGVLMRVKWRRVILDEAHIVRNHKSATSAGVSALLGDRRWCLTGTPVQNKDLDLFALLKFLRCTPFDDLAMWKKWIDNKSIGGQERLNTIMRCILLRRTKQQLHSKGQLNCLPERIVHQKEVELTSAEKEVYQKVLVMSKTLFAQFLHQRAEKNAEAAGFIEGNKDSEYMKMHKRMIALKGLKLVKSHEILVLLLRLRQVCCHCGLIGTSLQEETSGPLDPHSPANDLLDELNKLSLEDANGKRKSGINDLEEEKEDEEGASVAEVLKSVVVSGDPVFDMSKPSSKIKAVMDCLKEVFKNKDDKAVVVSQWTSVLRLVEDQLKKSRIKSVTLNGSVSVPARQAIVNSLNDTRSDVKVMLLSLSAGGVGLNLCGANHLLVLDPHWNPQLEEQAMDRVYRVGQAKTVHIYKFMCVETVEQKIRKLQANKLELAKNVLTGAKNTNASKLSIEELKMMFNMGDN